MKVCITLIMVLVFLIHGLASDPEPSCCATRKVGSYTYSLSKDQVAREFPIECQEQCAYTRDGEDNSPDFCFKPGSLSSSCVGDNNEVSCGAHSASSCALCPGKHGSAWCHGDCEWTSNICKPKKKVTQVLLLTGGKDLGDDSWTAMSNVELIPRDLVSPSCSLPPLLRPRHSHSSNVLSGEAIICGGEPYKTRGQSCEKLTASGWQDFGQMAKKRRDHTGHTLASTILLVGGYGRSSSSSSEYIDTSGKSKPGPRISPERYRHCGVTVDQSKIVLIGGKIAPSSVTLMEGLNEGETSTSKNLPSLNIGRYDHACGAYLKEDGNMELIVVGRDRYGNEANEANSKTTETFSFPEGTRWKLASGKLPYEPATKLIGATVNGEFIVTGFASGDEYDINNDFDDSGYYYNYANDVPYSVEILLWSRDSESWEKIGTLQKDRAYPGIVAVDVNTLSC